MEDRDEILVRAQTIIKELRARLAAAERLRPEPVAIVGMACRFPSAPAAPNETPNQERNSDLAAFWQMTLAGRSAEQPAPDERWNGNSIPGANARLPLIASFLHDIDLFDAGFFDIPPSEATEMAPAQRLFLEVAWHAFEDAGHTKETLAGSETGVFVGHTGFHEYLRHHEAAGAEIGIYTGTGSGDDVIAGRLAYILNLHGPAMTVNTACSSSLVALHLARRSLLAGECRMAIAGGVNILGPLSTALAQQMGFMAADGRCRVFDERADGFGRGEGCGVVLLKRLSDAEADGDLIHAVIHGSAVNQDGRTNGLTAPNGRSQAALLRCALRDAGVSAAQVGYVEAHGTGTSLGDLIEFGALAEIYGGAEPDSLPCALGSAKANIGHQEGAAGVAGLLRSVLAIKNGIIPPLAGFRRINPNISLEGTRFAIPVGSGAWSDRYAAKFAGVSSFGWSGTNAHVVLGEAPARPAQAETKRRIVPYSFQRSRYWIPMRESAAREKLAPDDWFYETVWKEMPLPAPSVPKLAQLTDQDRNPALQWLIFADQTGVAEQLARTLAKRGDSYVLVWPRATFHCRSRTVFEADATDRTQIDLVFQALEAVQSKEDAQSLCLIYLQPLNLDPHQSERTFANLPDVAATEQCLEALIATCRALAQAAPRRTRTFWAVTRGAQAVPGEDVRCSLGQSPMHGFASAAALEHPEFWGGIIDLPPSDSSSHAAAATLLRECQAATKENRVAYREGRRFVPRLRRTHAPPYPELRLEQDATYLVTGAFGGIGPDLAEWLAENGAKHLLLLGRSGNPTNAVLQRLQQSGVQVKAERCDVADLAQMSALFTRLRSDGPPLRGILHAAAEVVWKPIDDLDEEDVRKSFHAKARGSLVLHELTKRMALDFFVFFSSAAVSIGARNAAAYSAGNSFMDALAFGRRSAGLPGLSIHWGQWMRRTAHSGVAEEQITSSGLAAMPAKKALNALGRLLAAGTASSGAQQLLIAQIDVHRLKAGIAMRNDSLFLSDLDDAAPKLNGGLARPAAIAALVGLPEADRIDKLSLLVVEQLRRALGWNAAQPVDPTRGFFDMGIDSLDSMQFKNYIEAATGTIQSSTLIFLYPNVNAVASFLDKSLFGDLADGSLQEPIGQNALPAETSTQDRLTDAETRTALIAELERFKGGQRG